MQVCGGGSLQCPFFCSRFQVGKKKLTQSPTKCQTRAFWASTNPTIGEPTVILWEAVNAKRVEEKTSFLFSQMLFCFCIFNVGKGF